MNIFNDSKPFLMMLVGLPGSGKSSFLIPQIKQLFPKEHFIIHSSDRMLEEWAMAEHLPLYGPYPPEVVRDISLKYRKELFADLAEKKSVIVDRTHLTQEGRAEILEHAHRDDYSTIAWVMEPTSLERWHQQLQWRAEKEGKIIPSQTLERMRQSFAMPSLQEGFEHICLFRGFDLTYIDSKKEKTIRPSF